MTNDILVVAEIRDGVFKKINAELVTAATMLADKMGGSVHIRRVMQAVSRPC
jgi:hypothetical protein